MERVDGPVSVSSGIGGGRRPPPVEGRPGELIARLVGLVRQEWLGVLAGTLTAALGGVLRDWGEAQGRDWAALPVLVGVRLWELVGWPGGTGVDEALLVKAVRDAAQEGVGRPGPADWDMHRDLHRFYSGLAEGGPGAALAARDWVLACGRPLPPVDDRGHAGALRREVGAIASGAPARARQSEWAARWRRQRELLLPDAVFAEWAERRAGDMAGPVHAAAGAGRPGVQPPGPAPHGRPRRPEAGGPMRPAGGVRLLYAEGCSHWRTAQARLFEALDRLDMGEVTVDCDVVRTPEDAERVGFKGSPTILLDGWDPFPPPSPPVGLSCRVFETDAGQGHSPSVEQLVSAFARRLSPVRGSFRL